MIHFVQKVRTFATVILLRPTRQSFFFFRRRRQRSLVHSGNLASSSSSSSSPPPLLLRCGHLGLPASREGGSIVEEEEGTRKIFEISIWSPCQSWLPATGGGGGGHKSINGVHTYLVMHSRTQQGRHKKEETSAQMGAVALDGHHTRRVLQNASFFCTSGKNHFEEFATIFHSKRRCFSATLAKKTDLGWDNGKGRKIGLTAYVLKK